MHSPSGAARPRASCIYIRQRTLACVITYTYIYKYKVSKTYNYKDVKQFVYVIAWVAVVFGINCASNAGRKLVIVRGAAEHYYCFLPTLREQLIQNTTANHAIIN